MKILLVSWEYPPVVVGGLGRHVHHLATELRHPRAFQALRDPDAAHPAIRENLRQHDG